METSMNLKTFAAFFVALSLAWAPSALADYEKGQAAYSQGDYATALKEVSSSAQAGDARSQWLLGAMYQKGAGVPHDEAEGDVWFRKAADQGLAEAQSALGSMYSIGQGVKQDDVQALVWFRKAADQGNAHAQYNLGIVYSFGKGVPKDDVQAVAWFQKSAKQGLAKAETLLCEQYHECVSEEAAEADRLAKEKKMMQSEQEERSQQYAHALYVLGEKLREGKDLGRANEAEAAVWYRKAADMGYAPAQCALGSSYMNGSGVPKDNVQAFLWLSLATAKDPACKDKLATLQKSMTTEELDHGKVAVKEHRDP
jgi:TPR repeat protein